MTMQEHPGDRWVAAWTSAEQRLRVFEPTSEEIAACAPVLADYYNDPHNRAMMANTVTMTATEVAEHWHAMRVAGARPFFLERDGELLGDADLRHMDETSAELAILVGRRAEQGRGLGLRFGILIHALAFRALGLQRIYVAILPKNLASQGLFARLGYTADDGPRARSFADEESDLTFSMDRAQFEATHGEALSAIECRTRAHDG